MKTGIIVLLALLTFMVWYKYKYSMDYVDIQEIHNPAEYSEHVLIATQGSDFKDALLEHVLPELITLEYYIKVIDVSKLETIDYNNWNAICLIHTWEQWSPPKSVEKFMNRIPEKDKLVVLTTSGSGTSQIPGIDGITSASVINDVDMLSSDIIRQMKAKVQGTAEN